MSKAPLLNDIIKQLKADLIAADNDSSDTGLMIAKAEVSLGFSISNNESGDLLISYQDDQKHVHSSSLKLTFSRKKESPRHADLRLTEDDLGMNETPDSDDFESFKKRFQASVKLKHGQSPLKKKNIFDCD
jgi:hypothetical protein